MSQANLEQTLDLALNQYKRIKIFEEMQELRILYASSEDSDVQLKRFIVKASRVMEECLEELQNCQKYEQQVKALKTIGQYYSKAMYRLAIKQTNAPLQKDQSFYQKSHNEPPSQRTEVQLFERHFLGGAFPSESIQFKGIKPYKKFQSVQVNTDEIMISKREQDFLGQATHETQMEALLNHLSSLEGEHFLSNPHESEQLLDQLQNLTIQNIKNINIFCQKQRYLFEERMKNQSKLHSNVAVDLVKQMKNGMVKANNISQLLVSRLKSQQQVIYKAAVSIANKQHARNKNQDKIQQQNHKRKKQKQQKNILQLQVNAQAVRRTKQNRELSGSRKKLKEKQKQMQSKDKENQIDRQKIIEKQHQKQSLASIGKLKEKITKLKNQTHQHKQITPSRLQLIDDTVLEDAFALVKSVLIDDVKRIQLLIEMQDIEGIKNLRGEILMKIKSYEECCEILGFEEHQRSNQVELQAIQVLRVVQRAIQSFQNPQNLKLDMVISQVKTCLRYAQKKSTRKTMYEILEERRKKDLQNIIRSNRMSAFKNIVIQFKDNVAQTDPPQNHIGVQSIIELKDKILKKLQSEHEWVRLQNPYEMSPSQLELSMIKLDGAIQNYKSIISNRQHTIHSKQFQIIVLNNKIKQFIDQRDNLKEKNKIQHKVVSLFVHMIKLSQEQDKVQPKKSSNKGKGKKSKPESQKQQEQQLSLLQQKEQGVKGEQMQEQQEQPQKFSSQKENRVEQQFQPEQPLSLQQQQQSLKDSSLQNQQNQPRQLFVLLYQITLNLYNLYQSSQQPQQRITSQKNTLKKYWPHKKRLTIEMKVGAEPSVAEPSFFQSKQQTIEQEPNQIQINRIKRKKRRTMMFQKSKFKHSTATLNNPSELNDSKQIRNNLKTKGSKYCSDQSAARKSQSRMSSVQKQSAKSSSAQNLQMENGQGQLNQSDSYISLNFQSWNMIPMIVYPHKKKVFSLSDQVVQTQLKSSFQSLDKTLCLHHNQQTSLLSDLRQSFVQTDQLQGLLRYSRGQQTQTQDQFILEYLTQRMNVHSMGKTKISFRKSLQNLHKQAFQQAYKKLQQDKYFQIKRAKNTQTNSFLHTPRIQAVDLTHYDLIRKKLEQANPDSRVQEKESNMASHFLSQIRESFSRPSKRNLTTKQFIKVFGLSQMPDYQQIIQKIKATKETHKISCKSEMCKHLAKFYRFLAMEKREGQSLSMKTQLIQKIVL